MNKIGHRATALLLCVVLLFGLSISAGARESQCIDHYNVKASALGNGKISYDFAGGPVIFGVVASMAGTHDFDVEIYGLVQNGVLK